MIVIDTNQLDFISLNGPPFLLLQKIAAEAGHGLMLSSIVLDEHLTHYRNRLMRLLKKREEVDKELRRALSDKPAVTDNIPASFSVDKDDVERAIVAHEQVLRELFEVIELDGESAIEALRREARRLPPASTDVDATGSGARDAGIWLSTIKEAARRGEVLYLVSADLAAFHSADLSVDQEHVGLASYQVAKSLPELFPLLAEQISVPLSLVSLTESRAVREAVADALNSDDATRGSLENLLPGFPGLSRWSWEYLSEDLLGIEIFDAHAYKIGELSWSTIRSRWNGSYRVDVEHKPLDGAEDLSGSWLIYFEVVATLLLRSSVAVDSADVISLSRPKVLNSTRSDLRDDVIQEQPRHRRTIAVASWVPT